MGSRVEHLEGGGGFCRTEGREDGEEGLDVWEAAMRPVEGRVEVAVERVDGAKVGGETVGRARCQWGEMGQRRNAEKSDSLGKVGVRDEDERAHDVRGVVGEPCDGGYNRTETRRHHLVDEEGEVLALE